MKRIVKNYELNTNKDLLLAHDKYFDGLSWHRGGKNTYLFRKQVGVYYLVEIDYFENKNKFTILKNRAIAFEWYKGLKVKVEEFK